MRDLEDVPRHRCGIHSAADHRDQVGYKDEPQATVLENVSHG
jgi:hypothetical protein